MQISKFSPLTLLAVALLLLLPLLLPASSFYLTIGNYIAFGALVALGLYLLTGLSGMTSFGQAAFMGLAAYTTALLTIHQGWNPWLTLPLGVLVAVAGAVVLGGITARAQGPLPAPLHHCLVYGLVHRDGKLDRPDRGSYRPARGSTGFYLWLDAR